MLHADYKYVNVAVGGVFNRKGIYDFRQLGDPSGLSEGYCTYFRYNDDMKAHFQNVGSVKQYRGSAFADWLPIDIDSDDLQQAQYYLQHLVQNMDDEGIDTSCCRFYFSGSKGFHVMIPSGFFEAEPSEDIHKRFRKVAVKLADGINIDTNIYDKTRLFRLANTINNKSGLYKIELYPFEAMSLDIEEIKNKAKQPSERLEIDTEYNVSESLKELYHEPLNRQITTSGEARKVTTKICMSKMMTGTGEGERDQAGIRVAAHLKQSGLTDQMLLAALDEWNKTNNPPLDDNEISRIFRQSNEGYEFGCFDEMLKERCDPKCLFYKESWNRF